MDNIAGFNVTYSRAKYKIAKGFDGLDPDKFPTLSTVETSDPNGASSKKKQDNKNKGGDRRKTKRYKKKRTTTRRIQLYH